MLGGVSVSESGVGERRRYFWRVVAVVAAAFMIRMDIYIVNISIPSMSRFFGVSTGDIAYVSLAYLLFVTSTMILFGRIGDRFGLKRLLVVGYLLFAASSFLCGISTSLCMLIVSRCLQGLGGALLFTSAFGIIPRIVPREMEGWAYGLWSTACGLGITVGAPLGGIISGFFTWRWIFLIAVPVGIAAAVLVVKVIPPDRKSAAPAKVRGKGFDIVGTLLSLFGLFALVFGLNRGPALGWDSSTVLAALICSVVLLVVFILWERKYPDPLVPFGLFRNRDFLCAVLAALIGFMLVSGNSFLIPFYLELAQGLRPQLCGLMLLLYSVIFVFVSPRAGQASEKIDPRILGAVAMVLLGTGFGVFSLFLDCSSLFPAILFLLLLGPAFGLFFSPNNYLAMRAAPGGERGVSSGIYQTAANLGMVFGVCFFEAAFSQKAGRIGGDAVVSISGPAMAHNILGGFRSAYFFGVLLCIAGFCIFSLCRPSGYSGCPR
jgi:EmrB/QacA subfamily drug resistance transporter